MATNTIFLKCDTYYKPFLSMIFRSMGLFEFSGECELYRSSGVDEFVGRDVIDTVVDFCCLFKSMLSSPVREYLDISLRSTLL